MSYNKLQHPHGYIMVCIPDHPHSHQNGYMYEHRLVMENELGRYLKSDEHIHHIDGDRTNNHPNNLQLVSPAEHVRIHKGTKEKKRCLQCGTWTTNKKYCSASCSHLGSRKVEWPSPKELKKKISEVGNWCKIGREYGVSDNAVRKWAKKYGII